MPLTEWVSPRLLVGDSLKMGGSYCSFHSSLYRSGRLTSSSANSTLPIPTPPFPDCSSYCCSLMMVMCCLLGYMTSGLLFGSGEMPSSEDCSLRSADLGSLGLYLPFLLLQLRLNSCTLPNNYLRSFLSCRLLSCSSCPLPSSIKACWISMLMGSATLRVLNGCLFDFILFFVVAVGNCCQLGHEVRFKLFIYVLLWSWGVFAGLINEVIELPDALSEGRVEFVFDMVVVVDGQHLSKVLPTVACLRADDTHAAVELEHGIF